MTYTAPTARPDDQLEHLAGHDPTAYLATLTDDELRFRIRAATAHHDLWDADRFTTELNTRNTAGLPQ